MAWNDAVITLGGTALMTELINGGNLTITRAEISENTVNVAALMLQKAILSPMTVPVEISSIVKSENCVSICVQIRNTGVVGSHRVRQLGIYAQTETSEETLFAIIQNDIGEDVPPEAESPKFLLELGAGVYVSNADNITVVIDPASSIVTKADLEQALEENAGSSYGYASETEPGLVSTEEQTFGGDKTFSGQLLPAGATDCDIAQARKLATGSAAATTENCPPGAWYGKYE